jgi:hypothetical protein
MVTRCDSFPPGTDFSCCHDARPTYIFHHHHPWLDSPKCALAFLRSFCQLKYPAIASSGFVTRVFSRVGVSATRPNPGHSGGPIFSVRAVSLSRLVPILKRQDLAFCPCISLLSRVNVAQEPWRGHACNRLGMNKWRYSSFVSVHVSARCVPSRPLTTPSTPTYTVILIYSFFVSINFWDVVVEWLTRLLRIRKVLGLILGPCDRLSWLRFFVVFLSSFMGIPI